MMTTSTRVAATNFWKILFQLKGSIWSSVLPYCVVNCLFMVTIELLAIWDIRIAFSPSGHGLMTLIVSFLVISKVNLAYDRYMNSRHAIGHALAALRELNQSALLFTQHLPPSDELAFKWRRQLALRIVDLMDCTIRVIKNPHQANYLARNVDIELKTDDDPMLHVHALRTHAYNVNMQAFEKSNDSNNPNNSHHPHQLELLERMKMLDMLNDFVFNYRNLLKFASTPLPFPLIQMGRTFLFLWTFSIPLVLRGVVNEIYSAMAFVFFLTYGFIGLELVAMKLMDPFGDGINDLNVTGMKDATSIGIEKDVTIFGEEFPLRDKRLEYNRQRPRPPMQGPSAVYDDGIIGKGSSIEVDHTYHSTSNQNVYHSMT